MARCSICESIVKEVRVLEPKAPFGLKKVLDFFTPLGSPSSEGLACAVFKKHLHEVSIHSHYKNNYFIIFW